MEIIFGGGNLVGITGFRDSGITDAAVLRSFRCELIIKGGFS